MKTLNLKMLAVLVALVGATSTQAAQRDENEVTEIARCHARGPDSYIGGIGVYQDKRDQQGVLRGSISDNYIGATLVCMQVTADQSLRCTGFWNNFRGIPETVQIRLTPTSAGEYRLDLSKRSRIYGGGSLTSVSCKTNQ